MLTFHLTAGPKMYNIVNSLYLIELLNNIITYHNIIVSLNLNYASVRLNNILVYIKWISMNSTRHDKYIISTRTIKIIHVIQIDNYKTPFVYFILLLHPKALFKKPQVPD